jgi:hypothetical protein
VPRRPTLALDGKKPLPLEATFIYDESSLRAAARTLFRVYWRRMRLWAVGAFASMLLVAALLWYFRIFDLLWFPLVFLVVNPLLWVWIRRKMSARMMKKVGKSAEIRLTPVDFTIVSGGEAHTFPWGRFKATATDQCNLYLFVTVTAAYVLPTQNLRAELQEFAVAQIAAATGDV